MAELIFVLPRDRCVRSRYVRLRQPIFLQSFGCFCTALVSREARKPATNRSPLSVPPRLNTPLPGPPPHMTAGKSGPRSARPARRGVPRPHLLLRIRRRHVERRGHRRRDIINGGGIATAAALGTTVETLRRANPGATSPPRARILGPLRVHPASEATEGGPGGGGGICGRNLHIERGSRRNGRRWR